MRLSLEFSLSNEPLDLSGILPESVLGRTRAEITRLPVRLSGHPARLGDICRVRMASHGKDELILSGDTAVVDHIGWHMTSGSLVVDGDAGYGAGEGMSGGRLELCGCAGDCLGLALKGGLIHVHGSVGDWCGANIPGREEGMRGGVILVAGNAGRELGSSMRRGLIYVVGTIGEYCASRLLAGTILCAGRVGKYAAAGMRRGSLVAGTIEAILPGFLPSGLADTGWLRLYLETLKGLGIPLPEKWAQAVPHSYTGDMLESGKGEILVYDEPQ